MTWKWFPFFLGAPLWASIGIAVFATLVSVSRRRQDERERVADHFSERLRALQDPDVVSLSKYRRERDRRAYARGMR
jgi:hypothetical protein